MTQNGKNYWTLRHIWSANNEAYQGLLELRVLERLYKFFESVLCEVFLIPKKN